MLATTESDTSPNNAGVCYMTHLTVVRMSNLHHKRDGIGHSSYMTERI